MNDLEARLPVLLGDAAERITVHQDLEAVVGERTVYPRLIERPQHHSLWPATVLAAASIAALIAGLAVVVPTVRERAADRSAQPEVDPVYRNHTDVYPLLADVPAWAGEMSATLLRAPDTTERRLWALIARRGQDSLLAPIIVSTGESTALDVADGIAVRDTAGRPTYLFGAADSVRTVAVTDDDGSIVLTLSGAAGTDVLLEVLGAVTLHDGGSSTTFTVGELPPGLDLVVEPTVQPQGVDSFGIATSPASPTEGTLSIDVVTDLSDLRLHPSRVGAAAVRSIFIGGTGEQLTGWYAMPAADSIVLAWKLDPGIALVLTASRDGITAGEGIQIARDVVLTDETTWSAAYDTSSVIEPSD